MTPASSRGDPATLPFWRQAACTSGGLPSHQVSSDFTMCALPRFRALRSSPPLPYYWTCVRSQSGFPRRWAPRTPPLAGRQAFARNPCRWGEILAILQGAASRPCDHLTSTPPSCWADCIKLCRKPPCPLLSTRAFRRLLPLFFSGLTETHDGALLFFLTTDVISFFHGDSPANIGHQALSDHVALRAR